MIFIEKNVKLLRNHPITLNSSHRMADIIDDNFISLSSHRIQI